MMCLENKCLENRIGNHLIDTEHHQMQLSKYTNYKTIKDLLHKEYTVSKQDKNQITILYACKEREYA